MIFSEMKLCREDTFFSEMTYLAKSFVDEKTELNFVLKCSLKMKKNTVKSPAIAIIAFQKIH